MKSITCLCTAAAFVHLEKATNKMEWEIGRANGGYKKKGLFSFSRFDGWLMKCDVGEGVSPHRDPSYLGKHYRLNILLRKPEQGGTFRITEFDGKPLFSWNRSFTARDTSFRRATRTSESVTGCSAPRSATKS